MDTVILKPTEAQINFLTTQINQETPEQSPAVPFAFFKKDQDGNIIAGCNGFLMFGSIYTDQLWVNKNHRKRGLGKELMQLTHTHGKQSDCKIATVQTMDFQNALPFYQGLGYAIDYIREGYEKNAKCYFLSLKL